jgi:hypothetical protein
MRRLGLAGLVVLLTLLAGLGSAQGAGTKKLVEGSVFDTTCAASCSPCPPPCGGPIPAPQSRHDVICAYEQRRIVCPLAKAPATIVCVQAEGCPSSYPLYLGEGAVVTLHKRGAPKFLAKLPIEEGHFRARLSPGDYVIRPYLPEPQCWSGQSTSVKVTPRVKSPVSPSLFVSNACVAHPDARR